MDHPARAGQGALRRFRETGEAAALVEAVCDVIDGRRAVTPVNEALRDRPGDLVLTDADPDTLLIRLLLEESYPEEATPAEPEAGGALRFAPFEPAYLADELFHGLPDDEHPATWIAGWLNVIFPEDGTERRWSHRLKDIPDHARELVLAVVGRICAIPGGGGAEVAELVAIAAELMLPSREENRPRAPGAVLQLSNIWREELPQAIDAWTWSDDAFAGFLPVLEALLALPLQGEGDGEADMDNARPELLAEIAAAVTYYSAQRRERVIENWPADEPRPRHVLSDDYPNGDADYIFVDVAPEEMAVRAPILATARRFSDLVADVHHMVCPLPRGLMRDLAADMRRLDACPSDVGWLMVLADQMVEDWSFHWLGDTYDWPEAFRPRHPAVVRAEQLAGFVDQVRALGLDALADALSVWLLGTQVLFCEGDLGLPPARLKAFVAAIGSRDTAMRAALARVGAACRDMAGRGSAYGAFYARLLQSLIPPPRRPNLVMLDDYPR